MLIIKILVLVSMLAMHVIGDWVLQVEIMRDLKQKSWWQHNYGFEKNARDYKMVLLMHAMLWSACVMIPMLIYQVYNQCSDIMAITMFMVFVINMTAHAWIDDLKANKSELNLIQDHIIHIIQVLAVYFIFIFV